jgi:hypothetical protein
MEPQPPSVAASFLKKEYIPAVLAAIVVAGVLIVYLYSTGYFGVNVSTTGELTEAQKLKILENLKNTSAPVQSVEEKKKILEALSQQSGSGYEYSEEGRLQILHQLKEQSQ